MNIPIAEVFRTLDERLESGLDGLRFGISEYCIRAPQIRFLLPQNDNEGNKFSSKKTDEFHSFLNEIIGADGWTKKTEPDLGYWTDKEQKLEITEPVFEYYWEYGNKDTSSIVKSIREYIQNNFGQHEVFIRKYDDTWALP